ncbi:MAG: transposase [bacterium]|nr:transposase [bacterium]
MTAKHYSDESHAHYLTFSCYKKLHLFLDEIVYRLFLDSLNQAHSRALFRLYGFVIMPNHVHLLLFPKVTVSISAILTAIKQPFSYRALNYLGNINAGLYQQLTVRKGDKLIRRFWQAGGGYDRNVFKDETFVHTLNYMHDNPVRKKLVASQSEWKWSSARVYEKRELDVIKLDYPEWW